MTHYLTFEASRSGQLQAYLTNMAKGTPPLESARAAFGDLDKLRKDLDSYLERRRVRVIAIPASMLSIGRIEVSELTAGGAAIMPLRMESKHGVTAKTAEALAVKVRKVAAQYPGDPLVEITLAEAEIDAGHVEAAEVAADRALKTDPRNVDAMLFKGRALAERAAVGQIDALFDQARKWFIAANKIDPEDPEPLMLFHRSYQQQGIAPTTNAIAALHYASDLAPQDEGLRIESAIQYLRSGKGKEARQRLIPVAFDPHGDALAEAARTAIKHIDRGQLTEARRVLESGGESEVKATAEGTS